MMNTAILYNSDNDGYNALGPVERRDLAGDHTDDDGLLVDESLTTVSDGVDITESDAVLIDDEPVPSLDWTKSGPKPTTRIISQTIPLIAGADGISLGSPIQVLPADPNRECLIFRLTAGAPDVRWSDDLASCYGAGMIADTDQPVQIPHTGALWILPTVDAPSAYLHYHAVVRNV